MVNYSIMLLLLLMGVAFLTLLERKVLSYMQERKGPNKVVFMGLFQPFSDALKLLSKEFPWYMKFNYFFYTISPMFMMSVSMMFWNLEPLIMGFLEMNHGFLFFFSCLGMGVYPVMVMGWSSYCTYSFLGSFRSVAQTISFEVTLIISMFPMIIYSDSYNLMNMIDFMSFEGCSLLFMLTNLANMFIVFYVFLAELNRTPMDLVEGESELVSGFNTEYFGSLFSIIFLSEYMNIIFMSMIFSSIFLWVDNYFLYTLMIFTNIFLILWIRANLPRIRYDMLMYSCWMFYMPLSLVFICMSIYLKYFFWFNLS